MIYREEGYKAYYNGKWRNENPYSPVSDEGQEWDKGWVSAYIIDNEIWRS